MLIIFIFVVAKCMHVLIIIIIGTNLLCMWNRLILSTMGGGIISLIITLLLVQLIPACTYAQKASVGIDVY